MESNLHGVKYNSDFNYYRKIYLPARTTKTEYCGTYSESFRSFSNLELFLQEDIFSVIIKNSAIMDYIFCHTGCFPMFAYILACLNENSEIPKICNFHRNSNTDYFFFLSRPFELLQIQDFMDKT